MSPIEIEVLLHCYYNPAQHPRSETPAVRAALKGFLNQDLIYLNSDGVYSATERGIAHVKQLCGLPLPSRVWVDAQGQVINI